MEKMKKSLLLLMLAGLVFLSSCVSLEKIVSLSAASDQVPLKEFIIGKWDGSKQVSGPLVTYQIRYALDFKNGNTLGFIGVTSEDDYEDEYIYQFVSDKIIQVQGRRDLTIRQWEISRNGEKLKLCFT